MTKFFPPVSPTHFQNTMERHWISLGNHSSLELMKGWYAQGCAYGHQIFHHDNDEAPDEHAKWVVINPPTGSGKTEGIIVYCSMMVNQPPEYHPGVLLVTRQINDADLLAKRINELSKKAGYAVSFHSDNSANLARDTLAKYPVLVITHAAYETALKRFKDQGAFNQTWPSFYSWQESGRRLVVIDEAPTLIETSQVELDALRRTLSMVPQAMRGKHTDEVTVLDELINILEKQAKQDKCEECVIPRYKSENGRVDMNPLLQSMQSAAFNEDLGEQTHLDNASLFKPHKDRLKAVEQITTGDMYYARIRGKHTLNCSSSIVPQGIKGAIILDATASANVMYELFDNAKITIMPKGMRKYGNVALHVNRGQNVGKTYLKDHTESVLGPVLKDLNQQLSGRDVFVATHKAIKGQVQSATTNFKKSVGTWGAIDGSNQWKDCDTAVIIGLPTKPDTWTANLVNGFRGMQSTQWLQSTVRPFGDHSDIRSALKTGDTVAQIVQAINRIRCRKVIDSAGNCPDATVYLLLPDGQYGDRILQGIIEQMDGIVFKPWVIQGVQVKETKKGRPSGKGKAFNPLLDFLHKMTSGKVTKAEIIKETNVSLSTFKRFVIDTKKEASSVWNSLEQLGVKYVSGTGKHAETYFVKI